LLNKIVIVAKARACDGLTLQAGVPYDGKSPLVVGESHEIKYLLNADLSPRPERTAGAATAGGMGLANDQRLTTGSLPCVLPTLIVFPA
jgi:hypothetical protein